MHVEIAWSWNQKNGEVSAVYAWGNESLVLKRKYFFQKKQNLK